MTQSDSRLIPTADSLGYVIEYPRFKEICDMIVMCLDRTAESKEAHCMVLEGGTGAGKTTLVRKFEESFKRTREVTGNRIPVLYVETPSPVTVKGMAAAMLEELGDPMAHRGGTMSALNSRLVRLIKGCMVELVILDDIQHLIDASGRVSELGDWLKVLIKNTGIPFLIVGLENKVTPILKHNAQLQRLFSSSCVLDSFQVSDPEERKEYGSFISLILKKYAINLDESIPSLELMTRIHYATGGYAGQTINLLRDCQYLARQRTKKMSKQTGSRKETNDLVDLAILNKAFTSRFATVCAENPFLEDFSKPFIPQVPKRTGVFSDEHQSRSRKKRSPALVENTLL